MRDFKKKRKFILGLSPAFPISFALSPNIHVLEDEYLSTSLPFDKHGYPKVAGSQTDFPS